MKSLIRPIGILISLVVASSVRGYVTAEFPGWDDLTRLTPFVIIVRCTHAPVSPRLINGIMCDNPLLVHANVTLTDVEMVATLKTDMSGPFAAGSVPDRMAVLKAGNSLTLWSEYRPCQSDEYLLFVNQFEGTNCFARDLYRVVPLGHSFNTNWLSGKSLDEQVKFMIQYRLNNLKQELQDAAEEKGRLEQGVSMPANAETNSPSAVPKSVP